MSNDGDLKPKTLDEILSKHSQAAHVLVVTGLIEDTLEKLLLTVGRSISNKLAKRIFAGMGPLHSLSGKVEILFLFEQIDEILFQDLMVVKDVRNAFAHTTRYVSFSDEEIAEKCRRLSTWTAGADPENCFYQRSLGCVDVLANKMNAMMYAKALREPTIVESDD